MNIAELGFLAVEDHKFQRSVLLRILAGLGATKMAVAADGREALDIVMAPDASIDIIISDLDMPGMDGLELMRHLGEAGIPVAIILASGLQDVLIESVDKMAKGYGVRVLGVIEKPITPAKLGALIALHSSPKPGLTKPRTTGQPFTMEQVVGGLKEKIGRLSRIAQPVAPVNRSVLAAISGGDVATAREILAEFRRINDDDAGKLKLAVEEHNIQQITLMAERIKGASRTVGALTLASVCERLEDASCFGKWKEIEKSMQAFKRELGRLNSYCEAARDTSPIEISDGRRL